MKTLFLLILQHHRRDLDLIDISFYSSFNHKRWSNELANSTNTRNHALILIRSNLKGISTCNSLHLQSSKRNQNKKNLQHLIFYLFSTLVHDYLTLNLTASVRFAQFLAVYVKNHFRLLPLGPESMIFFCNKEHVY